MIDYRAILSAMIDDDYFPGWAENTPPGGREVGWTYGPDGHGGEIPYDYDSMDWRDAEFPKPTQVVMDALWNDYPERFDYIQLRALYIETTIDGDVYEVFVEKPYNIDGATGVTLELNNNPLPSPVPIGGSVVLTLTVDVVVGVSDDRPHNEILIEVK